MSDIDFTELFHGKEIAEKEKLFKSEMEAIDKKYEDFFGKRESRFPSQEHDSIFNHCMIYTANGTVSFIFSDEELPQHIKADCIDAFKKVYPGATQHR